MRGTTGGDFPPPPIRESPDVIKSFEMFIILTANSFQLVINAK